MVHVVQSFVTLLLLNVGSSLVVHSPLDSKLHIPQRRGAIVDTCQPFPGKRVVLATVNAEFFPFFQNWLIHAKPFLQSTEQLVAVAQDADAVPLLEKLAKAADPPFVVMSSNTLSDTAASTLASGPAKPRLLVENIGKLPWNDKVYGELVNERPREMTHFLELGCTLLYTDIDTAWLQDPFLEVGAAGEHDMYITDDDRETGRSGDHSFKTWNFCTCFMYVQPTTASKNLIAKWSSSIPKYRNSNQMDFNLVLYKDQVGDYVKKKWTVNKTVDFVMLPREKFPSGPRVLWNKDAPNKNISAAVNILHANFVNGIEAKEDYLACFDKWLVNVSTGKNRNVSSEWRAKHKHCR